MAITISVNYNEPVEISSSTIELNRQMEIDVLVTWGMKGNPEGDPYADDGSFIDLYSFDDIAYNVMDYFEQWQFPYYFNEVEDKYITYYYKVPIYFNSNIFNLAKGDTFQAELIVDPFGEATIATVNFVVGDLPTTDNPDPELPEPEQPDTIARKIASKGRVNQLFKEAINNNSVNIFNSDLTKCPTFSELDGYSYSQSTFVEGSTINTYVVNVGNKNTLDNQLFTEDSISFRTSKKYKILLRPNSSGSTGSISNTIYYNNSSVWSYENGFYIHRINMEFQLKNVSTLLQRATATLCIECTKSNTSNIMSLHQIYWEYGNAFNSGYAYFDVNATNTVTNITVSLTTSPLFSLNSGTSYTVPTNKRTVNHTVYWPLMYLTYIGGSGEKE